MFGKVLATVSMIALTMTSLPVSALQHYIGKQKIDISNLAFSQKAQYKFYKMSGGQASTPQELMEQSERLTKECASFVMDKAKQYKRSADLQKKRDAAIAKLDTAVQNAMVLIEELQPSTDLEIETQAELNAVYGFSDNIEIATVLLGQANEDDITFSAAFAIEEFSRMCASTAISKIKVSDINMLMTVADAKIILSLPLIATQLEKDRITVEAIRKKNIKSKKIQTTDLSV